MYAASIRRNELPAALPGPGADCRDRQLSGRLRSRTERERTKRSMGHQSLVYGVIEVFPSGTQRPDADSRTQTALAALPESDDWPFLVRSMFSATFNEHVSVAYMLRPIHFAASLKTVEWEWEEWLVKFERLLSMLDGQ